jgi:predicted RNase H-like HicB family nuclease
MKIDVHIDYFQEDGVIVALCPELQVSSFGDTLEEAERSIKEALELFFAGCEEMGTLHDVLEESGFVRVGEKWLRRRPVKTMETSFEWAQRSAAYA